MQHAKLLATYHRVSIGIQYGTVLCIHVRCDIKESKPEEIYLGRWCDCKLNLHALSVCPFLMSLIFLWHFRFGFIGGWRDPWERQKSKIRCWKSHYPSITAQWRQIRQKPTHHWETRPILPMVSLTSVWVFLRSFVGVFFNMPILCPYIWTRVLMVNVSWIIELVGSSACWLNILCDTCPVRCVVCRTDRSARRSMPSSRRLSCWSDATFTTRVRLFVLLWILVTIIAGAKTSYLLFSFDVLWHFELALTFRGIDIKREK